MAVAGRAGDALLQLLRAAGIEVQSPTRLCGEERRGGEGESRSAGLFSAVLVVEPENVAAISWRAIRALLARRGRVVVSLAPGPAIALFPSLSSAGLEPKELFTIHQEPRVSPHDAVIVAACGKPGGLVVTPLVQGAPVGPTSV